MKKTILLASAAALLTIAGCGLSRDNYEKPAYNLIYADDFNDTIEIRRYQPKLIAKTTVTGTRDEAASKGFRVLADFIFGNNTVKGDIAMTSPVEQQSQDIAMTSPVEQQAVSKDIAMTSPVGQTSTGENEWVVTFTMPSEYTMETLPKPNNDAVEIVETDRYKAVVLQYSGTSSKENIAEHVAELDAYVAKRNLPIEGNVMMAFYDPPWTPWFMRRNEVMYRLQETAVQDIPLKD